MSYQSDKKKREMHEQQKKAVSEKMESAANLAESYRKKYEQQKEPRHKYEAISEEERTEKRKNHINRKLLYSFLYPFYFSLGFLALGLLLFFPFKNVLTGYVNKYMSSEAPSFSAVEIQSIFSGSTNSKKTVANADIVQPAVNEYYARISCTDTGLNSKLIYSISDAALLEGVAQLSSTPIPGYGRPMMIYGYNTTFFMSLDRMKNGNQIKVETNYGIYRYEVTKTGHFSADEDTPYSLEENSEKLVLCTSYPFGKYNGSSSSTFYVIAEKVSGPAIKY